MTFFYLISTAISSIFYGFIVTVTIMAILYVALKSISNSIVQAPMFFITGLVLAILLVIQTSLMIGAMQAKDAADSAELYLHQLLENYIGTVGAQDSQRVFDAVITEYPIIGTYLGVADFSGNDVSNLASTMHETITDYLNSYIWHRVWWILGIIFTGCFVPMLYDKKSSNKRGAKKRVVRISHKNYDDF